MTGFFPQRSHDPFRMLRSSSSSRKQPSLIRLAFLPRLRSSVQCLSLSVPLGLPRSYLRLCFRDLVKTGGGPPRIAKFAIPSIMSHIVRQTDQTDNQWVNWSALVKLPRMGNGNGDLGTSPLRGNSRGPDCSGCANPKHFVCASLSRGDVPYRMRAFLDHTPQKWCCIMRFPSTLDRTLLIYKMLFYKQLHAYSQKSNDPTKTTSKPL